MYKDVHAYTHSCAYKYTYTYTCSSHTYLSALWLICFRLSPSITAAFGWPISEFLSAITHFITGNTGDDRLNGGEP